MAHPYKVNDEDEDFKDLDPAVAEDMAFAKALQNSLESFAHEQGSTVQAPEDDIKVPSYTREAPDNTGEVPRLSFTAEEIAQDDLRREEELYGPPSPLKVSRTPASLNPQNDEKIEKTPTNSSVMDASNHVANDTTVEGMEESYVVAKKAPWAAMIKNDPLAERVLAIKIAMLLGTIVCPNAYGEASQEPIPGIQGSEGATATAAAAAAAAAEPDVEGTQSPAHASGGWDSPSSSTAGVAGSDPGQASPGHLADMAAGHDQTLTSSQVLGSPDTADAAVKQAALEAAEATDKEETETAGAGSSAPAEGFSLALDDVVALGVADVVDDSGRVGQHFDEIVAHTHAARVAAIEAALASQNENLGAALNARRAGHTTRGEPAAVSALASRNQSAPSGPAQREAGDSAGDEEMDWLLDEFPVSPRPGSEEAASPRQRSQPQ